MTQKSYRNDMWELSLVKLIEDDVDSSTGRSRAAERIVDHCAWRFRGAANNDWIKRCTPSGNTSPCGVDTILIRQWCEQMYDL